MTIPKCANVAELSNSNHKKEMKINRFYFLKVLQTVQFLGKQGLPVRGHIDEESNFTQLLNLRANDIPGFTQWLSKKKHKYTSHDVQNEMLEILSNHVLRKILLPLKNKNFAVICDEYTDLATKEQLSFFIRWVDNFFNSYEKFL